MGQAPITLTVSPAELRMITTLRDLPESPLADQGFDAVFIKNDFTGLVVHAIPITNLQIQSCGVSVHDYCSSFSIYGNPALILCIGMGELV